jgi:drug/metabolite transporter (DMT)-like permease
LADLFAYLSAVCFGTAVVTSKFALRTVDARRGAAISLPASTSGLLAVFLVAGHGGAFDVHAVAVFAAVGLGYPGLVALLRFYATDRMGPAITSSVLASTTPLFALAVAAALTDEAISSRAVLACCGVAVGILLLTSRAAKGPSSWRGWWLAVPIAAGAIAGAAQVGTKAGLRLWPEPLGAALISYVVSSLVILAFVAIKRPPPAVVSSAGVSWFIGTGVLNGAGVLSMFAALKHGPVTLVAPIVAAYPLVTLFLGAALLSDERLTWRRVSGAGVAIGSIAYLVSA